MKRNVLAVLAAAAIGAVLGAGCGNLTPTPTGFCTGDSSCATTEICHPTAKICVTKCTSGNDCPSNSKNCLPAAGKTGADGGAVSFCGCSTTQLCNGSSSTDLVCNDSDKVCVKKCTVNGDCPDGRECDTSTGATAGQCKPKGSATCSPACSATQACDTSGATPTCVDKCTHGSCGTGKVCNTTSGACETSKACSSSNAQPDTCSYGQSCSGTACADTAKATCGNFTTGSTPLAWNPASSTGPVIYDIVDETVDDAAFCMAANRAFTVTVKAYRTDADWPATLAAVPGFRYYDSAGAAVSATPNIRPSGYVHTGKNATFKVTLCAALSTMSLTAGFAFDNGNAACVAAASGVPGTM